LTKRDNEGNTIFRTGLLDNAIQRVFIGSAIMLYNNFNDGDDFYSRRTALKSVTHIKSKTSQFEIVVKPLARFNSQLKVKESLKRLLGML